MPNHQEILKTFDINSLPNLDIVVLGALELFQSTTLPKIAIPFQKPIVVGSGNAAATGQILFGDVNAVMADESTFSQKLAQTSDCDGVVIISASGGKHAPIIAAKAAKAGKNIALITNTPNSPAAQQERGNDAFSEYVLPKNREPYTYNTSTYLGMILAKTGEDAEAIQQYIETVVDGVSLPDFSNYQKYFVIVPPEFSNVARMLQIKFIELFGREIARDVETSEYMRHAVTVVPSDNELFISFGEENKTWGKPENRLFIPLPEGAGYGAMIAVGYYIVGKIQAAYPHLFKDNIAAYTTQVSELFGSAILPIVE